MNAKISMFVICVEVIIYLLLYNLHVGTFEITFTKSISGILKLVKMKK